MACFLACTLISSSPMSNKILANTDTLQSDTKIQGEYREHEVVVLRKSDVNSKLKAFSSSNKNIKVASSYTFSDIKTKTDKTSEVGVSLVKSDKYSTKELIKMLKNDDDVLMVEPNYVYHTSSNDTYSDKLWAHNNVGQNGGVYDADINLDRELLKDKDSTEKVVAIIDTGVDYTHEDLKNKMWHNPYNKNKLKGEYGYDFVNNDSDPMDDNNHGTHCAGIIAAENDNEKGVAGVASSDNIKIMSLKFLDKDGMGDAMNAVAAYNYIYKAQCLGTRVVAVNNSWGGGLVSDILTKLVNMVGEKGAVSVFAAGNESMLLDEPDEKVIEDENEYAVFVGATNEKDQLAVFSNYGDGAVDIAAPGTNILSTIHMNKFNGSLYSDRDSMCYSYKDFNSGNVVRTYDNAKETGEYVGDDDIAYGIVGNKTKNVSANLTSNIFMGEPGGKSLEVKIPNAKRGDVYKVLVPYDAPETIENNKLSVNVAAMCQPDIETEDPTTVMYNVSEAILEDGEYTFNISDVMFLLDEEKNIYGETRNDIWRTISLDLKENESKKRAVCVMVTSIVDGDITVNVDELAISKPNLNPDSFGKYDYFSGTSMATPQVSGAVAAIANAKKYSSAKELKQYLLACSRKNPNLEGKITKGRQLDLSRVDNPLFFINNLSVMDGKIKFEGYFLNGATVKINGTKVDYKKVSDNFYEIDAKNYINKTVELLVTNGKDEYKEKIYISNTKSIKASGYTEENLNGTFVNVGSYSYYVDNSSEISLVTPSQYSDEEAKEMLEAMQAEGQTVPQNIKNILSKETIEQLVLYPLTTQNNTQISVKAFGESEEVCEFLGYVPKLIGEPVYSNEKIYALYELDQDFSKKIKLFSYDMKKGWDNGVDVTNELVNYVGSTLVSYEKNVYILGGYDSENKSFNRDVYKLSGSKLIKNNGVTKLPADRAFAKAYQVGTKMVVTLGSDKTDKCPKNMVFDGSKWKVSSKNLDINNYDKNGDLKVFDSKVSPVGDGLTYVGEDAEALGDIFTYTVSSDKFTSNGMATDKKNSSDAFNLTVIADKLYIVKCDNTEEEWDDYFYDEDDEDDDDDKEFFELYSMKVKTPFIKINNKCQDGSYIMEGDYIPYGNNFTLTAYCEPDYVITEMKVNTTKVKASSGVYAFKGYSTNYKNGITVSTKLKSAYPADNKKPGKTKILKIKRLKKNKAKITLKKVKKATGYQIKYSTSKKFKKKKTRTVNTKKTKVIIKKLKKKKKYFVKARTYRKVGKKKYYSKWTKTKTIKK